VDATTGSLGQGISIAGGMALSHKLAGRANRVFCIVGDGELNEGQCWEAFQFIAHHRLNNLTVFVTGTNSSSTASWMKSSARSILEGNSAPLVLMW
jgi:transketolase